MNRYGSRLKRIAKTKDGDIYEVRLQRQFPNCEKYKKCCTDDKEFWEKYEKQVKKLFDYPAPEGFDKA